MFTNNIQASPVRDECLSTSPWHIKEYAYVFNCASAWKVGPMWKILLSIKKKYNGDLFS